MRSFYVDNCVCSVDTEEELASFMVESTDLLTGAGMELRMWEYNPDRSGVGLYSRCGLDMSRVIFKEEDGSNVTNVLGLKWNKSEDTLSCDAGQFSVEEKLTKRQILSIAQKIFDPLGFVSPVTLIPKLLLQEAWALKVGWDAELPTNIRDRICSWLENLGIIGQVKIPRLMTGGFGSREGWTLHVFCNASRYAYAVVIFLRCEAFGSVSVQLLQSKSRVAPVKKTTIPRLELLARTIGSRLASTIKTTLSLHDVSTYYWSDSTTAIAWIRLNDDWGTFVGNRVREICKLTDVSKWNHVPGEKNPADLPSRGCQPKFLLESRWWEGPEWLKLPQREWPSGKGEVNEDLVRSEMKKTVVSNLINVHSEGQWYLRYFSTYSRIVNLIARILRFVNKLRKTQKYEGDLSVSEVKEAELRLLRMVQQEVFKKKDMIEGLHVKEDESGLFRVKTKIINREDSYGFRFPIILPANHGLVELLVQEVHLKNNHAGVQTLMCKLREKYWIIRSRRVIKSVLKKCIRCRRYEQKNLISDPAPLPIHRVKDAVPFEVVGVDLAGPLYLKDKSKVWAVLFACAVYRAVHLELVSSLSTECFIQSLRRFIARRGRPSIVYSDNGTNFKGTENALSTLDWESIKTFYSIDRIDWKFNPPSAAWWGGWWERLVRMVKALLVRILGRSTLDYEELYTVLCDVEGTINARPLTYVSEDDMDLIPLSPASFLREIPEDRVPDLDVLDSAGFEKRFRYRQRLREDFRRRFRQEYLGQLIERAKVKTNCPEIRVGDLVLIGSDNKKKLQWPLARVIERIVGKDGNVRVLRLKTSTGELVRPIQRLYPLEVDGSAAAELKLCRKEDDSTKLVKKGESIIKVHKQEEEKVQTRSGRQVKVPERYRP